MLDKREEYWRACQDMSAWKLFTNGQCQWPYKLLHVKTFCTSWQPRMHTNDTKNTPRQSCLFGQAGIQSNILLRSRLRVVCHIVSSELRTFRNSSKDVSLQCRISHIAASYVSSRTGERRRNGTICPTLYQTSSITAMRPPRGISTAKIATRCFSFVEAVPAGCTVC